MAETRPKAFTSAPFFVKGNQWRTQTVTGTWMQNSGGSGPIGPELLFLTFWAMGPSICACLHECIFFKLVEEGKSLSILLDNYFIIYGQVWRYWHPSKMLIKPHFGINKSMFIHNYINGQINRVKVDSAFIFLHHNYRNIFRSFPLFETLFYIDN